MPTTITLPTTYDKSATTNVKLDLARAVLGPGQKVWLVTEDNGRGDLCSVERAVASGQAYMGVVRSDVLALDVDTSERKAAAAGLQVILAWLRTHGIGYVLVASGRPAHRHLFAVVPDQVVREALRELATAHQVGVRADNALIRPPLSPHRKGLDVSLIEPADPRQALAALRRAPRRPLKHEHDEMLRTGVSTHPTPSERLMTLCLAMYQAGWTMGESYDVLRSNPGGRSLHKTGRDPWVAFQRTWRRAIERVRASPSWGGPQELIVELQALRDRAEATSWSGQAGITQRMVLMAVIDLAMKLNQIEVNYAERDLLLATSRATRKSIRNALRALVRQGWLRRVSTGTGKQASRYRLLIDKKTPCTTSTEGGVRLDGVFVSNDLFARGGGLGASAAWVYEVLMVTQTVMTTKEVALAANRHPATARRALLRMAHHGVVTESKEGWKAGPVGIHDAAVRRGSAGAGQELAEQHRQERRVYRGHEEKPNGGFIFYVRAEPQRRQCEAQTAGGLPCRSYAMRDETLCASHLRAVRRTAITEVTTTHLHPYDRQWVDELEADIATQYEVDAHRW